ncbi:hypothetical protein MFRU_036g00650 [Monilinia fructicola]|uniref:Serine carboxypeptidase S28 n=1 Tax=Monilinia fructicola TaxID=38448 RepID=A0A5M9J3Y1_MONFR|nr:hypothetical protein EYC84_011849 [Monilinia fructicola]KAG4026832.1 hypothetical protein MFRU_036g00650 [Monilinia fructicola]
MVSKLYTVCATLTLFQSVFSHQFYPDGLGRKISRTTIPRQELALSKRDDIDASLLYPTYNLSVPIDYFHNETRYEPHSNGTFPLRYWFDATYYKPGGPVIILQSGETNAEGRLPFLQKGLLHELAVATNGIGVVLEHRYYGDSIPTPDFSTENLRFLTTEQALMDEVYFARNIVFPGLEDKNLTAPNVAYIGYGGSYAGAFNAFLRKLYPDTFWGTISSSGVVEAIYDYWQYFEPIRVFADQKCIKNIQLITNSLDNIVIGQKNNTALVQELKNAWGFPNVTYTNDFMSVLVSGVWEWQSRNWDPALVGTPYFEYYCGNLTSDKLLYPSLNSSTKEVQKLLTKGGYGSQLKSLTIPYLNWIGWLTDYTTVNYGDCSPNQDSCYSTHNLTYYTQDDASQDWRLWPYQYCTEWGFLQNGASVPSNQLPLLSRTIDLPYTSIVCEAAFNITTPPDVERINKYGGFSLSYPRLAYVDGEQDPWRPATPHASPFNTTAHNRTSTTSEPFLLIEGAVHHWDENGVFPNETTADFPPKTIKKVQGQEIKFVKEWLEEWKREKEKGKGYGRESRALV